MLNPLPTSQHFQGPGQSSYYNVEGLLCHPGIFAGNLNMLLIALRNHNKAAEHNFLTKDPSFQAYFQFLGIRLLTVPQRFRHYVVY